MKSTEYDRLVGLLIKYSEAYYKYDNPLASDEEYDNLAKRCKTFEDKNPDKVNPLSPNTKVGVRVTDKFTKAGHNLRMWSLDDVFTLGEAKEWFDKVDLSKCENTPIYICMPKYDGASLNLIYKNGFLHKAITRGDGFIGEDVTNNVIKIKSIPLKINATGTIEIRGEIAIGKNDFEQINKEREINGEPLFVNPRNAASGSLRQLDPNVTEKRNLVFIPWGVGTYDGEEVSLHEIFTRLSTWGFNTMDLIVLLKGGEIELDTLYTKFMDFRETSDIALDGIVIRLDNEQDYKSQGFTSKVPKGACAFKFPPVEKVIVIKEIKNQIGRTGVVTPVAKFEPVLIDGSTVSSATLHNYGEIKRLDLKLGDQCILIKSGDIIPKITKVFTDRREKDSVFDITPPTKCEVCNSDLVNKSPLLYCVNPSCKAKLIGTLINFVSRGYMNINGLGEKMSEVLVERKAITRLSDLYTLEKRFTHKDLELGEVTLRYLFWSINKSKGCPLTQLIGSLGIPMVGRTASKLIINSLGSDIFNYKREDIVAINGVGETMTENFISYLENNKDEIKLLIDLVKPTHTDIVLNTDNQFYNKTIVLTGSFPNGKDVVKEALEKIGAKISGSVSKKTDLVIYGDKAGSKLDKAKQLKIELLKIEDLNLEEK